MSQISSSTSSRIQVAVMIHRPQRSLPVTVLVNSGADDNFIDANFFKSNSLPLHKLTSPKEVLAIDSKLLEMVTHRTDPLKLILSSNHHEFVELSVISSPLTPIVLGISWLKEHNPHIDWSTTSIREWSSHCHACCLQSAVPARSPDPAQQSEVIDLSNVPREYHDLREGLREHTPPTPSL